MFHVFLIIIALTGQPVQILRSNEGFDTKAACEAKLPGEMAEVQKFLDENPDPAIKGQYAVGDGQCLTDAEAGKAKDSI